MWDQTARDQDGGGSGGSLAIRLRGSLDTGTRTIGASWVPNSLMNILAYLGSTCGMPWAHFKEWEEHVREMLLDSFITVPSWPVTCTPSPLTCLILALQSLQMKDAMGCPFSYLHVAGFAQGWRLTGPWTQGAHREHTTCGQTSEWRTCFQPSATVLKSLTWTTSHNSTQVYIVLTCASNLTISEFESFFLSLPFQDFPGHEQG